MSKLIKIKCDACGKEFIPGTLPNGVPTGVVFQDIDDTTCIMCHECVIEMRQEVEQWLNLLK